MTRGRNSGGVSSPARGSPGVSWVWQGGVVQLPSPPKSLQVAWEQLSELTVPEKGREVAEREPAPADSTWKALADILHGPESEGQAGPRTSAEGSRPARMPRCVTDAPEQK